MSAYWSRQGNELTLNEQAVTFPLDRPTFEAVVHELIAASSEEAPTPATTPAPRAEFWRRR